MTTDLKELDFVSLKKRRKGLEAGATGTVVLERTAGETFVVEFCDDTGSTVALQDIPCTDLELVTPHQG